MSGKEVTEAEVVAAEHGIVYRAPMPHHCTVPPLAGLGAGSVYVCGGCGQGWVSHWTAGGRFGTLYVNSMYEWRPETQRERRRRLGVRWWQRCP